MLELILAVAGLAGAGLVTAMAMKKVTLAQVQAEVDKIAADAKAEEVAIVSKIKSMLSSL